MPQVVADRALRMIERIWMSRQIARRLKHRMHLRIKMTPAQIGDEWVVGPGLDRMQQPECRAVEERIAIPRHQVVAHGLDPVGDAGLGGVPLEVEERRVDEQTLDLTSRATQKPLHGRGIVSR